MDLRIVKTRRSIQEAFLKLRATHPLERIRVTELCELATINKTTFYKHYQDVYALSDEIENETIAGIMQNFERVGSLFSNPHDFITGLLSAFGAHRGIILTLFSGRMNVLVEKVERQLKAHYLSADNTPERDITISFLVGGASRVLMEPKYDERVLTTTLSTLLSSLTR